MQGHGQQAYKTSKIVARHEKNRAIDLSGAGVSPPGVWIVFLSGDLVLTVPSQGRMNRDSSPPVVD